MFRDFLNDNLGRTDRPFYPPKSQAKYVEFGYGQVEPNHLSAQRTAQIYAQLPANPDIKILEQGQFVKYDYAANDNGIGEVNFNGKGEWMLVYNEIKLYRDHPDGTKQWDCEFAMLKDDYQARIYSPYDYEHTEREYKTRWLNGEDAEGNKSITVNKNIEINRDGKSVTINDEYYDVNPETLTFTYNDIEYTLVPNSAGIPSVIVPVEYEYDDFTADVKDIYEMNWTNDPYTKLGIYKEKKMRKGTSMVPRVFKTNVGDIFTTNMVDETTLAVGDELTPNAKGILAKFTVSEGKAPSMIWQVVKVYTMPDGQKGVKIMRIA